MQAASVQAPTWHWHNGSVAHAACRHVAMLLGAAKLLKQHEQELQGSVKLLFQPAEEGGAGGKRLVQEGERASTAYSGSSASAGAVCMRDQQLSAACCPGRLINSLPALRFGVVCSSAQVQPRILFPQQVTWLPDGEWLQRTPLALMQAISRASRASLAFTCGPRFPLAPSTQRRVPSWHLHASLT